jgi:hypothetical protein
LQKLRTEGISAGVSSVTLLHVASARGAVVRDVEGREYIDFAGVIGVMNNRVIAESFRLTDYTFRRQSQPIHQNKNLDMGHDGTPLFLCVMSLNQCKVIGASDGLAPISRPGCGRLADSK